MVERERSQRARLPLCGEREIFERCIVCGALDGTAWLNAPSLCLYARAEGRLCTIVLLAKARRAGRREGHYVTRTLRFASA